MNKPKLFLFLAAFLLLGATVLQAQNVIYSFTARAVGDAYILLEWKSASETGLATYKVERSLDGSSFAPIADMQPKGDNSTYQYEDHSVIGGDGSRVYYYRIRALMTDNTSIFSPVQSVTLNFSGIQQTWGSIKALFR
jgi:hypothetical protein